MKDTRNIEERISLWLEEDAMRHFPDHLLKATYEQTRKSKQQVGWREFVAGLSLPNSPPRWPARPSSCWLLPLR